MLMALGFIGASVVLVGVVSFLEQPLAQAPGRAGLAEGTGTTAKVSWRSQRR